MKCSVEQESLSITTVMFCEREKAKVLRIIPLHVLPSYFKNRAAPCCDRYKYGLFTAASILVVRVCVCIFLVYIIDLNYMCVKLASVLASGIYYLYLDC